MKDLKTYQNVINIFPEGLRCTLGCVCDADWSMIQEIRLRAQKPIALSIVDKEYYVSNSLKITDCYENAFKVTKSDIELIFKAACQYSLYSFTNEICQGFITINGGHRVGLCGTAVVKDGSIVNIKDISGLNIRIARQIIGAAQNIYTQTFSKGITSLLIVGVPSSGKTTILRDLCRILGNRYKIAVIDERNELSASVNGIAQNDIGINSDVFNGYPKAQGITIAIRVMSPRIIVCDEIGNMDDVKALSGAVHSGVSIIATAHAGSISEALKRKGISDLINMGAFKTIIQLGSKEKLGQLIDFKNMEELYV